VAPIAVALVAGASVVSANGTVKVLATESPYVSDAVVKPSAVEFLMTGGDFMKHLRWRHWGSRHARAKGTYYLVSCEPTCANPTTRKTRGTLVLSDIVACRGVRLYRRAKAMYYAHGRWRKSHNLGPPPNPCS
jgi:hypothetical protein